MDRLYHPGPDGYCGDEDNGQTSAWYVFSALGFYPVCPAMDQYVIGSPLFETATLMLENGNHLIISASENKAANRFIHGAKLNGKPYTKNWISHSDVINGATLELNMADKPNKNRGIDEADFPFSLSKDEQ